MSIELDVRGLSETIASLERKKAAIPKALKIATHNMAEKIAASAADYAPVVTGTLRDSIHVEDMSDGSLVVAEAPYSAYVEYGTRYFTGRAYLGRAVAAHIEQMLDEFWQAMGQVGGT